MDCRKRARADEDEDSPHKSSSYNVCDPCRGRKVRCGRERPICANCDKTGQECTWNGHGRKPSQSTAFKDAVARIGTQLERLEKSVFKIQDTLQRLHARDHSSNNGRSVTSVRPWRTCPSIRHEPSSLAYNETELGEGLLHGVGRRAFSLAGDCEIYSGPTSLHCLVLDAQELILSPMTRACIVQKHEEVFFKDRLGALYVNPKAPAYSDDADNLPPAMPPMAMLEAMIGPYFDQINPIYPLWTQAGLRSQISLYQAGHIACAVSANNVILMTLIAKFTRAVSQKGSDLSPEEQTFSSMENDLAGPFVTNARRAVKNTDKLLAPNLANVQALLSLCLVAPHCFLEGTTYRIFHQALYLSQLMGLSGRETASNDPDPTIQGELQERRNVFRCLSIISTTINWMTALHTGNLISDSFFNGSAEMPSFPHEASQWDARISLAAIEEQAFNKLFAPNQIMRTSHNVCTCATELLSDLDNWYSTYFPHVVSEHHEDEQMLERQQGIDLTARYYFLRAMLMHADLENQKSSVRSIEASQNVIRLIVEGWRSGSDLGHYAGLTCNLLICSSKTLVQILSEVHKGDCAVSGPELDLELLRSLQSIFKSLVALSHKQSYATRVATFIDILLDLATSSQTFCSPVLEAPPSGPTPDSVDSLFSSLPDFLKDMSYPSSTTQSVDSYPFLNHPPHILQDPNDPPNIKGVEKQIESHPALEQGLYDDTEGNNWWISPFTRDTMAAAEAMITPHTSIDGPIRH